MSSLPRFSNDGGRTLDYPHAPGLKSHRLALGCMHFGGSWDAKDPIPDEARDRARAALETALDLGWNFYDHADIYCRGKSEILFGELIRELKVDRESIIVQSKCGIRFPGEPKAADPHRFDFSKEHIIASAENSLERLGMEYLDILLLHRPDLLAEPEAILDAFMELKTAGKVRFFGVSNFTPPILDLFKAAGIVPVANQVELNLLKTSLLDCSVVAAGREPMPGRAADGTLEWHRIHGVITQAWAPMAYGYPAGRQPEKPSEKVTKTAELVEEIAETHGVETEAIVTAWLLRHPAMIQPVIGTRDPARLRACDQALKVELSREEWYALYLAGRGEPLP